MEERNESRYHIEQKNKIYILATSLIGDKLKLVCQDANNQTFDREFSMNELIKLSKYFQPNHTVEQIQGYLNGIIEKQRVGITQNESALSIILYLINKDQISIPLIRRESNNIFNYNNFSNYIPQANTYIQQTSKNNIASPTIQNQFIQNIGNAQQGYIYQNNANQQYLDLFQNVNQKPQFAINQEISKNKIKQNQLASVPNGGAQIPQTDSSHANYGFQYDENKISKLENEANSMRVEHEKLKNDMKRLLEEASRYKEENQVYKTDHDSLTKENAILKNENDNYKKQIIGFQNENKGLKEENNNFRNQITLLNKDLDAFENQNNQIRKMYEDLENENNLYKNQIEELNKENEILRQQVEELNNNFTLINNELENIKNENNLFKTYLEQQQNSNNEEFINKLLEEINIYKQKAEENDLLRKQIEELQYQHQIEQDRQNEEDEMDQGQEVKGDIIHDIKELEMITKKINKDENKKIIINLLYKASVDSDKASAFHEKCDQAQNTIVLVETKNGKRFGGYTTCSWSGNCVDKNDPQAFIFSFDKMKTYDNIPGDEAIGCYPRFGPIFLGCQIKIFDNAFSKGGTTFEKELNFNTEEDYELTGGDRTFEIKDIEVYEVLIE